jgi:hypothetical protein
MSTHSDALAPSRLREPRTRSLPSHQKRAGLGVWASTRSHTARAAVRRWKRSAPFDAEARDAFAAALAGLVRLWSPVLPAGTVATVPPQGASAPGPYAALELGRGAAEILGVPIVELLTRTEAKRWHGPLHALRQAPFECMLPARPPVMVLVLDDLVTSGRTMRLSIEAINRAGCAAFGFGYSGC